MKRKLALLLAGCLAISPAAAGLYPVQAFAAEAGVESKPGEQVSVSVSVSDENGTILTEKTAREANAEQYSMTVGDTRQLTAVMEQGDGFPALSTWSSETPEIIDIDDDGIITAISEGKGLISLSISYDVSQNPVEFKYEIIVNEAEAEVSEETAVVLKRRPARQQLKPQIPLLLPQTQQLQRVKQQLPTEQLLTQQKQPLLRQKPQQHLTQQQPKSQIPPSQLQPQSHPKIPQRQQPLPLR